MHVAAAQFDGADGIDLDVGAIYTNDRHYMAPLVDSLANSATDLAMRLILVDNASADGVETWTRQLPNTRVVRNHQRLGYAPNLNRILEASSARYVLLLNTDVYFDPAADCLAKMTQFMDQNPNCGLSVCRVLHPDGTEGYAARRFPTWRAIVSRRLPLARMFPHALSDHLYLDRDPTDSFACDWVSGCFMMIRAEAMECVGGFDLGFTKYFEDVDLSLRMALAGWSVMYNGQTHCYHHEQKASRRWMSNDAWLHCRSYARWLRKWALGGHFARALEVQEPANWDSAEQRPSVLQPHWGARKEFSSSDRDRRQAA